MNIQSVARSRAPIYMIALADLHEMPGWNCRDDDDPDNVAHVQSIAQTIAYAGVAGLDPLTVWTQDGKVYVSNGHCRLRAARYAVEHLGAQIVGLPCITEGRGASEADRKFSQISRNAGKPLSPSELARATRDLIAYGWTVETIAQKSGRSVAAVNASLDLLETPVAVQKLVASGRVSPTQAVKIVKKHGETEGTRLLVDAVDAARQKGRERATQKDIGDSPRQPRVNVKTRVGEIIEAAETDEELIEGDKICIILTHSQWRELCNLLDI